MNNITKQTATIRKWGNSLGVRFNKEISTRTGIEDGMKVSIHVIDDSNIMIVPTKENNLDNLLDKITDENKHDQFDL